MYTFIQQCHSTKYVEDNTKKSVYTDRYFNRGS